MFENSSELANKEKEINSKLFELMKRNKKMNENVKKPQRKSVISEVIKYKKFVSDFEEKNNNNNINKMKRISSIVQDKDIIV